ncbi:TRANSCRIPTION FACTOR HHO2 [Salix koriyanagi]|uniref:TRANSCRIPTION FACTOR HHO2 n=1 Tax=Salix koriyanagi TaxID=2511006 RepID=A0A9Q1AI93_9ROSI|nr:TRANSCRIPTION FACTOR HHO2 [Salix koriyanagi]
MDFAEKMQRCHEYVEALEAERRKIQVFERELPLCLELVTQAIEACKRELSGTTADHNMNGQPECSEQTSSEGPVLEEFIPIKRTHSSDDDENDNNHGDDDDFQEQQSQNNNNKRNKSNSSNSNSDHKKKSDWLRSVQLWNQSPDPPPKQDLPRKAAVTEVTRNGAGGAFQPFHREKSVGKSSNQAIKAPTSVPASAISSTAGAVTGGTGGGGNKREDKEEGNQRKPRRCWSPELHRRFLHALQQLGGSHASTPKQIRELMKVDGLTNDEVKSHLQKYRLHTRRPNPTIHNNSNQQAPQFVVVGGIWVPPAEYAAVAATISGETSTISAANGMCARKAAAPPAAPQNRQNTQSEHLRSEGRGSRCERGSHSSDSPSTSSSTHTTTTSSPVF